MGGSSMVVAPQSQCPCFAFSPFSLLWVALQIHLRFAPTNLSVITWFIVVSSHCWINDPKFTRLSACCWAFASCLNNFCEGGRFRGFVARRFSMEVALKLWLRASGWLHPLNLKMSNVRWIVQFFSKIFGRLKLRVVHWFWLELNWLALDFLQY